MCILWSLPSWQVIKGKIISWTEPHGKVTPGSFNFSKYFVMKRSFPYTLHPTFVSIFSKFQVAFFFSLSVILLFPVTVTVGSHQRFGYWFIISAYTPHPWHELQAGGIIKECLRLLQGAFRSVCMAVGNIFSSPETPGWVWVSPTAHPKGSAWLGGRLMVRDLVGLWHQAECWWLLHKCVWQSWALTVMP